jgi:tetratricopeptide (TPR) repeat protein
MTTSNPAIGRRSDKVRILLSTLLFVSFVAVMATLQARPASASDSRLAGDIKAVRELIRQGKVIEALQVLQAIERRSPNDPEAKFAVGEIFQELAALRAEQLQKVAPDSVAAHELLGQSLEAQGKLNQALAEYRNALEKGPATPGLHFLTGNLEWKLKNLDAAEAELLDEIKLNPHHAMANLRMGQILLETQRDQPLRGVAYLREATVDEKTLLEAHRELGKALRLSHEFQEALKELQFVESQRPNDISVHAQLAAVYKDMGDRERARQEMEIHARILRQRLQASQRMRAQQAH